MISSSRQQGQAAVETAALLPALLLAALACWQGMLIGWTAVSAAHAARAAARAAMVGDPPAAVAAAALPSSMRHGLTVRDDHGHVRVRVHVPAVLPGLDLTVQAAADLVRQ
jgi:hypothetical protein